VEQLLVIQYAGLIIIVSSISLCVKIKILYKKIHSKTGYFKETSTHEHPADAAVDWESTEENYHSKLTDHYFRKMLANS
jgi:hypothetical protein